MKPTPRAAQAAQMHAACITTDGVRIEVERVGAHSTVHGPRGARVYVRIRPSSATPGLDTGPRTCLSFSLTGAHAVGLLLLRTTMAGGGA